MSVTPWTFKDGANGGGPLDFPGRLNRSHLETSCRRGRASRSPDLTRAKEKPTGLKRRARDFYRRCERGTEAQRVQSGLDGLSSASTSLALGRLAVARGGQLLL
jgi:hypothetical protein